MEQLPSRGPIAADMPGAAEPPLEPCELVTMTVADQLFGVPVLAVRDVLGPQPIARIPLAPPAVAGAINLRGRIVTAIDVRRRLGLPPAPPEIRGMSVVFERSGELYSLIVDQVAEVMTMPAEWFEHNPSTMNPRWRGLCTGIYRLERRLLLVLDVDRLLEFPKAEATVAVAAERRTIRSAQSGAD
jgi:purine-binding chemotaxis protein CheW